jgi:glycosyltransferase involved in cell wall biosynthesis
MRICIDARMMGPENTRGIGRYIEELVRAMLQSEPDNRYILIVRKAEHPFRNHPSVETLIADIPWYGLAEQFKMPGVFSRAAAELVHVPHWNVPVLYRGPLIVTVHDLLLRHFPLSAKTSTRSWPMRLLKRLLYRIVVANAISHARRILVPTEFVESDVRKLYSSAKWKVVVTGEGMPGVREVRSRKLEDGDTDRQSSSFQLLDSYLLYVGSAYPHKGLDDLLAAWPKILSRHPDLRLVLVGEKDVFMRRIEERVNAAGLERVDFLGRVSDEELEGLYLGATAFVFPTHFEGFGLPPLEALAHGCPVIASDIQAMREVLGKNGATYFRLGDSDGILAAVESIMAQPEKSRSEAREAATELSRRHAWPRAAEKTLLAYGQASKNP